MSNKSKENEIEDLKEKIEIITQKLTTTKRDRDNSKKENRELQNEIFILQSNMRQMIPGFSNTSNSFPMLNELQNQLSEFFKCDCQDIFFDLLSPELNMEGKNIKYKINLFEKYIFFGKKKIKKINYSELKVKNFALSILLFLILIKNFLFHKFSFL